MTDLVRYIATIEGIGNATGQVKYCYPDVPSYADGSYVAGLAEPTSTTGGELVGLESGLFFPLGAC